MPSEIKGSSNFDSDSAGKVLQVVSVVKTDTASVAAYSSAPATMPSFSATITPTSSTSKILVMINASLGYSGTTYGGVQLYRDSTAIFQADAASLRSRFTVASGAYSGVSDTQYSMPPVSITALDTPTIPATPIALTYSIKVGLFNGATTYMNRTGSDRDTANYESRTVSTITLMEIGA